jgi:hypothetical protein
MPTATDPSPLKQACIHEQPDSTTTPLPTEAAQSAITLAITSLLPAIQPNALTLARQSLMILRQLEDHKRSLASLQQENYLPHSARLLFTLNGSKRASETADFIPLQHSLQTLLTTFQGQLKEIIVAAAGIERTILEWQLAETTLSLAAYLSKTLVFVALSLKDTDDNISATFLLASQGLSTYSPLRILSEDDKQTLLLPDLASALSVALDNSQLTALQPVATEVIATVTALCISPSQIYADQVVLLSAEFKLSDSFSAILSITIPNLFPGIGPSFNALCRFLTPLAIFISL